VIYLYTGRPGGTDVDTRSTSEGWPARVVAPLRGSWVGEIDAGGKPFSSLADAVLYVGTSQELEVVDAPASSFDAAYLEELDRRSAIEWGDPTRARRFLKLPPKP
jgi:hypothetical protein